MTETDRINAAEKAIREALAGAGEPITSADLGNRLDPRTPRSLARLAVQRMIGRGDVSYDSSRRYSLSPGRTSR
jgi:hypothetical protein